MSEKKIKSARITNELHRKITNRAIDWRFKKEWNKLKARGEVLAEEIYNIVCTPDVLAVLEYLPDGFKRFHNGINNNRGFRTSFADNDYDIYCSYETLPLEFHREESETADDMVRVFPRDFCLESSYADWFKEKSPKLYRKLKTFSLAVNDHLLKKNKFETEVQNLLNSVNTTKQLIEVLPEAEAWVPEVYRCNNLPAADKAAKVLAI